MKLFRDGEAIKNAVRTGADIVFPDVWEKKSNFKTVQTVIFCFFWIDPEAN